MVYTANWGIIYYLYHLLREPGNSIDHSPPGNSQKTGRSKLGFRNPSSRWLLSVFDGTVGDFASHTVKVGGGDVVVVSVGTCHWGFSGTPYPYYSHTTPIRIPEDMGSLYGFRKNHKGSYYWEYLESPLNMVKFLKFFDYPFNGVTCRWSAVKWSQRLHM